jgi:toxin HigB-1
MIQGWKDEALAQVMAGRSPRGFPATLLASTRRKLFQLDSATRVEDLRTPPGNRLHELTSDRAGQWSISVNDQYRLCFVWGLNGPENVEFVDYH